MDTLISIVAGCYNEGNNILPLFQRICIAFDNLPGYTFELILADNASQDDTRKVIREIAAKDTRMKAVFNARNVGPERSTINAIQHVKGNAAIIMASDLQDPPELIPLLVREWEAGAKVVVTQYLGNQESWLRKYLRKAYYWLMSQISQTAGTIQHFSGFALYGTEFLNALSKFQLVNPYLRGLVEEIGLPYKTVNYQKEQRIHGATSYSLLRYYDAAMVAMVNHSKAPLRFATFLGFSIAVMSLIVGFGYLVAKLLFWNYFTVGIAPLIIVLFFCMAVQLSFFGIMCEYVGAIYDQTRNYPLVIEEETVNI